MIFERRMQMLLSITIATCFSVVAWTFPGVAQDSFRVIGLNSQDELKVRALPQGNAVVSGTIPPNAIGITRIGECYAWCLVRYRDLVGWVDRRFLAEERETASSVASKANSPDPAEDCNSDKAPIRLSGCSALIDNGHPNVRELALAHSRRSDAYLEGGNLERAIDDRAKATQLQPDDVSHRKRLSEAYTLRAAVAQQKGDLQQAFSDYDRALQIDVNNHAAYSGRSDIYLLKSQMDRALADLRKAFELDVNNNLYRLRLARLHDRRGVEYQLKKNFDAAILEFTEALRLHQTAAATLVNRAASHAAKGSVDQAQADYTEAIGINPDLIEAFLRRGELMRDRKQFAFAIADFDEVLKREPRHVLALMLRALSYEESEKREAAVADYQAVLLIEPSHSLAKSSVLRLGGDQSTRVPAAVEKAKAGGASNKAAKPTPNTKPGPETPVPGAERREPPAGSVPWGKTVLVDDGTCPRGQIKEITGGNLRHNLPRQRRCIPR